MSPKHYDFFVIGGGSGGVRGARLAAAAGQKVGIAERAAFGGTCVNVGCVPKKLFSYASHFAEYFEQSQGFGWQGGKAPQFDMRKFIANKDKEITRLNGIYEKILNDHKVDIFRGTASFKDAVTLEIDGTQVTADKILIATGGTPSLPKMEGAELASCSDDLFTLEALPEQAVVIGGGYIAVEFAGILQGLGAKTTQFYRGEKLLRGFDEDISDFLAGEMQKKGVDIRFNDNVIGLRREGAKIIGTLQSGGTITADKFFFATGRRAYTEGLNLAAAGVKCSDKGLIETDEHYRTSAENIYAVGDIVGHMALTPVALREATIVVNRLFGAPGLSINYNLVPTAVFSNPQVATVGLTQIQADKQGLAYDVYKTDFTPLQHQLSGSDEKIFMKMLVEKSSQKVLGIHMVGDAAGETMQGFAVALQAGADKRHFDETIGIHPTAAEEFVTLRTAS